MNLFSPAQIAENYVSIGKSKVNTAIPKMFLLAVMAGVSLRLAELEQPRQPWAYSLLLSEIFYSQTSCRSPLAMFLAAACA